MEESYYASQGLNRIVELSVNKGMKCRTLTHIAISFPCCIPL